MTYPYLHLILCMLPAFLLGQTVPLNNPSFEDIPRHSKPPQSWYFCGAPNTSPPDVNPSPAFGVLEPARDGETYVGLITREDGTVEAIGQALREPLKAGECYSLSIYARRSTKLRSIVTYPVEQEMLITGACKLRVFGSKERCESGDLLVQSEVINQPHWRQIELQFEADQDYSFLILQAYFGGEVASYGNLQLDLVNLERINCSKRIQSEISTEETAVIVPAAKKLNPALIDLQDVGAKLNCSLAKNCDEEKNTNQALVNQARQSWYQLARALPKMEKGTQLEVGILSKDEKDYQKKKKRWLKRWTSPTIIGNKERILFTRADQSVAAVSWDYINAEEPYAYRFRKSPTLEPN